MEKIRVTDFFRTPNYESNYERNCYNEYVCECCGKKFITKDDTKNETLFRTIEKRTIDLLKEA